MELNWAKTEWIIFVSFALLTWAGTFYFLVSSTNGYNPWLWDLPAYMIKIAISLSMATAVPGGGLAWFIYNIIKDQRE